MNCVPQSFTPTADTLKDRVILITGAGDGLGRATAIAAAKAGAQVVLLGRTTKKLEKTYDTIAALGGVHPAIVPMNLNGATWNDHVNMVEILQKEFGRLDGLVHCAAHFTGFVRLSEVPPKDWMDGLQVNLTAAYVLTRACLPLLEQAPDASIVFLSDTPGRQTKAYSGIYGVTKAALESLSATWAAEYAQTHPQLRFNSFHPGPMRTQIRVKGYAGESTNATPAPDAAALRLTWLLAADSGGVSGQAL